MKKIVLFANWGLGDKVLNKLIKTGFSIECVVTQYNKDKDKDIYHNKVFYSAKKEGIKVYTSIDKFFEDYKYNLSSNDFIGLSVAFNKIIPQKVLDKLNVINFHPSKIPSYRGISPIEHQLRHKKEYIGLTLHYITEVVDLGEILAIDKFRINYDESFEEFIENFNEFASDFIIRNIKSIRPRNKCLKPKSSGFKIKKLSIPEALKKKKLIYISEFLNRPRIAIFSGNRAEFGILYPLIVMLSKELQVDLYVSGAHLLVEWNTVSEIYEKCKNLPINIIEIPTDKKFEKSLGIIYLNSLRMFKHFEDYNLSIILGDRIETFAFALASFYSKIPIVHIGSGDIANVPYFDTNVRHAISKISSIFFTTNKNSYKVLLQLGEEEWRIFNTGHLSLSYEKIGMLKDRKSINKMFSISENDIIIFVTFHPSHFKCQEENLKEIEILYEALIKATANLENFKIIWTYPNNDPNYEILIQFLKRKVKKNKNFILISNLGTDTILSLFKNFKVIVIGNSSLGLMETPYYCVPSINIGDRQTDRFRTNNVVDIPIELSLIEKTIKECILNYKDIKRKICENNIKTFFGDSNSVHLAVKAIKKVVNIKKEKLLNKKFIIRD